jgi:hypothetical protein
MNIKPILLALAPLVCLSNIAFAQDDDMNNSVSSTTTMSTTTTTTQSEPMMPARNPVNAKTNDPNYYADDEYWHNNPKNLDRALITKNATADSYYNRYHYDKPLSRAQVNEELVTWERAGYDPFTKDPYYPNDVHQAQVRISLWQAKYGSAGQSYPVAQVPPPQQ